MSLASLTALLQCFISFLPCSKHKSGLLHLVLLVIHSPRLGMVRDGPPLP